MIVALALQYKYCVMLHDQVMGIRFLMSQHQTFMKIINKLSFAVCVFQLGLVVVRQTSSRKTRDRKVFYKNDVKYRIGNVVISSMPYGELSSLGHYVQEFVYYTSLECAQHVH